MPNTQERKKLVSKNGCHRCARISQLFPEKMITFEKHGLKLDMVHTPVTQKTFIGLRPEDSEASMGY